MSRAASSSPAEPGTAPAGVLALDRLSERLLAAAAPLRVAVAESAAEREATYRLRHAHVAASGAAAAGARDGSEHDAYDAVAVPIAAWDGAALVGTVRLVFPAPDRPLPVEADFAVVLQPRGGVVEAGRLVIDPAHRGDPAHRAWGALFARAWLVMRSRGFAVLGGAASAGMVERLRAVGLPFEVLGPARLHWGERRHPVRLDPAGADPGWYAAPPSPARPASPA
jgi:N-acyl-L-homoserine lactone synthetase